ncbi:hypothetical protein Bca52824_059143 [Brassica carinata]|uniref:Uncharacterized protein n=1 Tax=Brassica carinata TaxID=52824 RepID=A0A8X7QZ55_BRACI|nr:hypothetical protein Bca52824_059143 [Brassica carinata]
MKNCVNLIHIPKSKDVHANSLANSPGEFSRFRRWKKRKINGGGGRQDSTQGVASGIFQINTGVFTFQRLVNRRLVLPEIRLNSGHKTRLHIGQLVKDTSASETDHRTGVNMLSLQRTFKAVLKEKPLMLLSFLHLLVPLGRNEAVIEEREQQGIQEIHNQIGEINEICKDLAKISILTLTTLELQLLKEDLSSHKPQTHTKIKLISDMLALGDIWHCTPDRGYCSRSLMLEKQEQVFWNVFINEYITWQSLVVGFKGVLVNSQGSPKANLSRLLRVLASFNLVQQELKTQTYAVGFLIRSDIQDEGSSLGLGSREWPLS